MNDDLRAYVAQQRRWRHPRAGAQGRVWRRRAVAPSICRDGADVVLWVWAVLAVVVPCACVYLLLVAPVQHWWPFPAPPAAPPFAGNSTLSPGQQGRFVYDAPAHRWHVVEPLSPASPVADISPCIMDTTAQGVAGRWVTPSQTTAGACHVGDVRAVAEFAIGEMADDATQQGQPARIARFREGDAMRLLGTTDQPMTNKYIAPAATPPPASRWVTVENAHIANGNSAFARGDRCLLPDEAQVEERGLVAFHEPLHQYRVVVDHQVAGSLCPSGTFFLAASPLPLP